MGRASASKLWVSIFNDFASLWRDQVYSLLPLRGRPSSLGQCQLSQRTSLPRESELTACDLTPRRSYVRGFRLRVLSTDSSADVPAEVEQN